jgi:carbon storage regulator
MLTLSRRAGHAIRIGDDIRIVVTEIRGNTVRIGIEAPRAMQVFREELWLKIQAENQAAADAGMDRDALDALFGLTPTATPQEAPDDGTDGSTDG